MYRVKTNGNYNILINDIKVYVSFLNEEGSIISNEEFERSQDLKNLVSKGLLVIEPIKNLTMNNKTETEEVPKNVESNSQAFVREVDEVKEPENVFIANPEENEKQEEKHEEMALDDSVELKNEEEVKIENETNDVEVNVEEKTQTKDEEVTILSNEEVKAKEVEVKTQSKKNTKKTSKRNSKK